MIYGISDSASDQAEPAGTTPRYFTSGHNLPATGVGLTTAAVSSSSGISCQNGPSPQGQFHRQSCNLKNQVENRVRFPVFSTFFQYKNRLSDLPANHTHGVRPRHQLVFSPHAPTTCDPFVHSPHARTKLRHAESTYPASIHPPTATRSTDLHSMHPSSINNTALLVFPGRGSR